MISISSAFALVSLFSASYVVIRYPFLGLVDLKDGDLFSKYFTQRKRWLWTFLNVLVIITIAIILAAIGFSLFAGPVKLGARDVFILTFFVLEMAFLVFLLGWYDRVQHPTVATFIWATLGIGILLAPFYLPAILIGSYRCKRLLDSVDVEGAVRDGDLRGF